MNLSEKRLPEELLTEAAAWVDLQYDRQMRRLEAYFTYTVYQATRDLLAAHDHLIRAAAHLTHEHDNDQAREYHRKQQEQKEQTKA